MDINVENLASLAGLATPKKDINLSEVDFYNLASASPDNVGLTEFESDLKNLDYVSLITKYNKEDVDAAIQAQLFGTSNYIYDNLQNRSTGNIIGDTVLGIGQGAIGSVGGLASLGASFINEDLGTSIAQGTNALTQGLQDLKSEELKRMQRAYSARESMLDRESEALYQRDLKEGSTLRADLRKLGRDALNSISNLASEGAIAGDIGAQALGSFALGGPTSKAARGLAEGIQLARAKVLGNLNPITRAQIAKNTAEMPAWLPTTMALEGGGGYTSGVQDIMEMPLETLTQNPDFVARVNELKNQNVPEDKAIEQARMELADTVGKSTAAMAAITAAGLSKFSKWAEAPFASRSFASKIGNVASEAFDESAQGVGTQLGQNLAVQMLADANRSMVENVGKNIVEGAVGGALSSGGIQGISTISGAGASLSNAFKDSKEKVTTPTQETTFEKDLDKLADDFDIFATKFDDLADTSKNVSSSEESIEETADDLPDDSSEFVDDTELPSKNLGTKTPNIDNEPEEVDPERDLFNKTVFINENDLTNLSESGKNIIKTNNDKNVRFRAISNLIKAKNNAKTQEEKDELVLDIFNLATVFKQNADALSKSEYVNNIPDESEEASYLTNLNDTIDNALSNPTLKAEIVSAISKVNELNKKTLSEENINTPEGKQIVRATLAQLQADPTKINTKNIAVLSKVEGIPENIKSALSVAGKIIKANLAFANAKKHLTKEEQVNYEIISKSGGGATNKHQISAAKHLSNLLKGIVSNNKAETRKAVENLNGFLEHLSNKMDAAKLSLENGGKEVAFTGYSAKDKAPYQAKLAVKSFGLAKAISNDYGLIKQIVDNINSVFPDLNIKKLDQKEFSSDYLNKIKEKRIKDLEQENKDFNSGKTSKKSSKKTENTSIYVPEPSHKKKTSSKKANTVTASNKKISTKTTKTTKATKAKETSTKKVEETPVIVEPVQYSSNTKENSNVKEEVQNYIDNNAVSNEPLVEIDESVSEKLEELNLSKHIQIKDNKYFINKDILKDPIEDTLTGSDVTETEQNQLGKVVDFEFASGRTAQGTLIKVNNEQKIIYNNKVYPFKSISDFKSSVPGITNITIGKKPSITSQLIDAVREKFNKAFKFNNSIKSEFRDVKDPVKLVKQIIESDNSGIYSPEFKQAFSKLFEGDSSFAEEVKNKLNENLRVFLAKTNPATGTSNLENLNSTGIVADTINGKFLNLVSINNGKYEFNEYLLGSAMLATVDWLLASSNSYTNNKIEKVLKTLGLSRSELSNKDKFNFDSSIPGDILVTELTDNIKKFWGVSIKEDAPSGLSEAIIGSLAASILTTIKDTPKYKIFEQVTIPKKINGKITKISQYKLNIRESSLFKDSPLLENRNFLSSIIQEIPERISYYDDDITPEPSKYTLHTNIPKTQLEMDVEERANNIEYYANNLTMAFTRSIGSTGFKKLLGIDTEGRALNKEHKAILDSKALVIDGAFDDFSNATKEMIIRAKASNKPASEVTRKFLFTTASQGRLQEINSYGPVSNKLTRILFRATQCSLDLSDETSENYDLYLSSIGQALGVKIGRNSFAETRAKTEKILKSLEPAIEIFRKWEDANGTKEFTDNDLTSLSDKDIEVFRNTFRDAGMINDITPEAIHVLLDYARFLNLKESNPDSLKNYSTYVSIEADGIAHGTIATLMLTAGIPNFDWIASVARGGISVGAHRNNAESFKKSEGLDFYGYSGTKIANDIQTTFLRTNNDNVRTIAAKTLRMFNFVFDSNIDYLSLSGKDDTQKGNILDIPRDIVKTVVMVLNYGSGISGITDNITDALVTGIYSRISMAMELKNKDPKLPIEQCFFPNDTAEVAKEKFNVFKKDLIKLTTENIYKNKKGQLDVFVSRNSKESDKNSDISNLGTSMEQLQEFAFTNKQLQFLSNNIKNVISEPAQSGTKEALGNTVETMDIVKDSSGAISSIYAAIYKSKLKAFLAKKIEESKNLPEDQKYRIHFGLSSEDIKELEKELIGWNPIIFTGTHNLGIPKYSRESNSSTPQARGVQDGREFIYVSSRTLPENSGVSLLPENIIAMGDVKLVAYLLLHYGFNTNNVFDGIESSLTDAKDVGLAANKAMAEAYKSNILTPFNKAFDIFITTIRSNQDVLEEALKDPEIKEKLIEDLFKFVPSSNEIMENLNALDSKELTTRLVDFAITNYNKTKLKELEIQARLDALKEVPVTVDNMSALNQGYSNSVKESDLSEEDQVNKLISKSIENYERLKSTFTPIPLINPIAEDLTKTSKDTSPEIADATSSEDSIKETPLTKDYLDKLLTTNKKGIPYLSGGQKAIFKPILDHIASLGITLYRGTTEDLVKKAAENGESLPDNADALNGWYSVGSKSIYLNTISKQNFNNNNNKIETILHELIHANTADKIYEYYLNNNVDSTTANAIQNLENLMNQFITDFINSPESVGLPYISNMVNQLNLAMDDNGRLYVPDTSSPADKARRLCEFIAYAQSNKQLIEKLKTQKVPETLLEKLKMFYLKLKELIFGTKASSVSDSYYSNIKFNTYILIKDNSLASNITDKVLASTSRINSTDPRLSNLVDKFSSVIQKAISVSDKREATFKMYKAFKNNAYNFAIEAQSVGYNMTAEEANAFVYIFDGISLASKLNSPAVIKAEETYSHIINNLDPKLINNDMFNFLTQKGKKDKTQAFPLFMALASVNPTLREAIAKIEVPSETRSANKNTLDKIVDNLGYSMMDSIDNYLVDSKMSTDMLGVLDNAIENIIRIDSTHNINQSEQNVLERLNEKAENTISELGENIKDLTPSDRSKFKAIYNALIAPINNSNLVKKSVISVLNTLEVSPTINQLFRDVIGTDASGKRLEAIIKQAKSLVQQTRQRYRTVIPSAIKEKFSDKITSTDYSLMFKAFAKTDISVLTKGDSIFTSKIFKDLRSIDGEYQKCLRIINNTVGKNASTILRKADELAEYMVNGKVSSNLLRNAYAIANLYGEVRAERYTISKELIFAINKLVSINAIKKLPKTDRDRISELFNTEPEGMKVILENLYSAQSIENKENISDLSKINGYKGYVPSELEPAQTVRVVLKDSVESKNLSDLGYTKVDSNDVFDYYYIDINTSGIFSQGGIQNIVSSVYGVDPTTGRSVSPGIMMITNPNLVRKYSRSDNIIPIYDAEGKLIALESALTEKMNSLVKRNTNLPEMLGAQIGRQFEEVKANEFNKVLLDHIKTMYENDPNKKEYVNVFDIKDPVIRNSVAIISNNTKEIASELFGKKNFLPIRRDLVEEVIGVREASVGDFWTGNTRWSPKVQQISIKMFELMLGKGAYTKLLKAEALIQKSASYARNWIVVKNPIVILGNTASNVNQLISNGVPPNKIIPLTIKYIRELEQFTKVENDIAKLKVQRALAKTPRERTAINATIISKEAIKTKMDVYPLIQAGEYSSIADIGIKPEDVEFSFGKLGEFLESQTEKLPDGIKQLGKYALLTKDTSGYQALNKIVQYSDLIAKAILFEHLTNKKNPYSKEEALDIIRDEFVNYDLQTGRVRGYLENSGMLWFYNYKLRTLKTAVALARRNPLFALIGLSMPMLPLLDGLSTIFTDNILSKLFDGSVLASFGPGMFSEIPFVSAAFSLVA